MALREIVYEEFFSVGVVREGGSAGRRQLDYDPDNPKNFMEEIRRNLQPYVFFRCEKSIIGNQEVVEGDIAGVGRIIITQNYKREANSRVTPTGASVGLFYLSDAPKEDVEQLRTLITRAGLERNNTEKVEIERSG